MLSTYNNINTLLNKNLGESYETVKTIYDNLTALLLVETNLDKLQEIHDNIDKFNSLVDVQASFDAFTTLLSDTEALVAQKKIDTDLVIDTAKDQAIIDMNTDVTTVGNALVTALSDIESSTATFPIKTYDTIADGIANSVNGNFFSTAGNNDYSYLTLYKNVSSVAQKIADYPSLFALNEAVVAIEKSLEKQGLSIYTGNGIYPVITDQDYKIILGYDSDEGIIIGKGLLTPDNLVQSIYNTISDLGFADYKTVNNIIPFFTDKDLKVILGYDTQTKKIVGALPEPSAGGNALPTNLIPNIAAINHLITYGQSLSVGANGQPVLSTTQPYNNITFNGGPRADGDFSAFKPLIEDALSAPDGGTDRGETPCSGAANYAITLGAVDKGVTPSDHVILASAAGHGGYLITQLNKGTTWYNDVLLAHISGAKALNTDYAVHTLAWVQGETDVNVATAYQTYYDLLEQLQIDAENDIQAISGQTSPLFFITYQTTYKITDHNEVAKAQLDLVRNNDKFYLSTPMYHLPYTNDNVHLTNVGYKWLGAYIGRAYKKLVIDNMKPDFINPISATRRGNEITVKFDVPTSPLVLDSTTLASTTNSGFKITDSVGDVAISSVAILGDDNVLITTATTPVDATVVRYALDYLGTGLNVNNGASGNLRDSTTDEITIDAVDRPLYHVAPHFELNVISLGE